MICLLLLGNGCLIAPDIEEEPLELNYPPEIILDSLIPSNTGIIELELNPECSPITFKVGQVRDRNVKNVLYDVWFMDWVPQEQKEPDEVGFIQPSREEIRPGPDFSRPLMGFNEGDVHTLQVIIADAIPEIGVDGYIEFSPDDPNALYDSYQWTFRLVGIGKGYCQRNDIE